MTTPNVGDLIEGKGVYAGIYEVNGVTKEAYFEPDFLRDPSGKALILSFTEAGEALARRNDGRRYGNGSENAVCNAIASGEYRDGDLVLAPQEFLCGWDAKGKMVRSDNLVSLLAAGNQSVKRIRDTINSASGVARWSVSGKVYPGPPSHVSHVRLTDGIDSWYDKVIHRSGVVPLRFFSPAP